jgi:hypothetical protein
MRQSAEVNLHTARGISGRGASFAAPGNKIKKVAKLYFKYIIFCDQRV